MRAHLRLSILSIFLSTQVVTAGANPISVKKGIDKTCEHLVSKLKQMAKPVKGREDIKVRQGTAHELNNATLVSAVFGLRLPG